MSLINLDQYFADILTERHPVSDGFSELVIQLHPNEKPRISHRKDLKWCKGQFILSDPEDNETFFMRSLADDLNAHFFIAYDYHHPEYLRVVYYRGSDDILRIKFII